jgi:arginine-tRNA-protein transferase
MRYKGDYSPQYLLDPASYAWDLLDDNLKSALEATKYLSLSSQTQSTEAQSHSDLSTITEASTGMEIDTDSSLPIFLRPIPGLLTKQQLLEDVDLDHVKLSIRDQEAECCDLVSWDESNIEDPHAIKGIIAELVSAVGKTVAEEKVVVFS